MGVAETPGIPCALHLFRGTLIAQLGHSRAARMRDREPCLTIERNVVDARSGVPLATPRISRGWIEKAPPGESSGGASDSLGHGAGGCGILHRANKNLGSRPRRAKAKIQPNADIKLTADHQARSFDCWLATTEDCRVGKAITVTDVQQGKVRACPPFTTTAIERWWARRDAPLPTLQFSQ
jgi:hypothetical protein